MLTTGAAMFMHSYKLGYILFFLGLTMITLTIALWCRDIVREATFQGKHTFEVQKGLRYRYHLIDYF